MNPGAMNFNYDSYKYFFDLLAFSLLLVPVFYALKKEMARRVLLTLGSVYVMYFIAARLVVFYLGFWGLVFLLHRLVAKKENTVVFWFSIIATLLPMLAWKFLGDSFDVDFNIVLNGLLKPLSQSLWEIDMSQSLLTPVGISFATFRGIDLLVKTWLGKIPAQSFGKIMFYGFFAPVQVAGPISEYEETANIAQTADPQKVYEGLLRIATGFIKIFLLSTLLAGSAGVIAHPEGASVLAAWLALFGFGWHLYLNFSGYSDVAIGIARVYGFELKENFMFPLLFRRNIQQYWYKWNMSLTRFTERNIFVPLGGYREKTQYFALFMSMMAIGLWHNFNAATFIYGAWHGTGMILHRIYAKKLGPARVPGKAETAFYHLLTYLFVSLAYPLLYVHNVGEAVKFYRVLVGI